MLTQDQSTWYTVEHRHVLALAEQILADRDQVMQGSETDASLLVGWSVGDHSGTEPLAEPQVGVVEAQKTDPRAGSCSCSR